MIFNAHTHYILPGRSCRISDYRVVSHDEWKEKLLKNGVSGALTMYCPPHLTLTHRDIDFFKENVALLEQLKKDDDLKWVPFAILSPFRNSGEELEELVNQGFKGLKLISVFDGVPYSPEIYGELVETAGELGIPTMIHTGWVKEAELVHVKKIVESFPDQVYIIAHMRPDNEGSPGVHLETLKYFLEQGFRVYQEISYVDHANRLKDAKEMGLVDRLLWGDDLPWGGMDTETHLARVKNALNGEDLRKVLWNNAGELFGS